MKFNFIILLILVYSCSNNYTRLENRAPYNSKGLALIYNEKDLDVKVIKGKLDNSMLQISHQNLNVNTMIKLINPRTNDYVVVRNSKRIKYPDFYKIIITQKVANELNIDKDLPLIEILEIKKNKSFVAEKAKIFNEEKKILSNAPVTSVQISNISKNKLKKKKLKDNKIFILIASFYSRDSASFLRKRITTEIPNFDNNKIKIQKKNNNEINLISGPYKTINSVKNDYIQLKNFGFEDLDITIHE